VLVTGAAGFIGSALARRLVADGHRVVALDDLSEGRLDRLGGVTDDIVIADVRDVLAVRGAAEGCDVVFHLAAKRAVERSFEEPALVADVNVNGTETVLRAAAGAGAVVVFASSSSVYGAAPRIRLREDREPAPRSPYARTKLDGERRCRAWTARGVRAISLRYFNVYGPGQDADGRYAVVIPRFVDACLAGRRPTLHGHGSQARDYTYVDDVVEATVRAASAPDGAWGRVVNVGAGARPTSVLELLERIGALTGVALDPIREPTRRGDVGWTRADPSLAAALLGFRASVGIDEGLRRCVAWARDRLAEPVAS
jgi:nucleoside-diphosphate-sugar epimerase